MMLCH